MSINRVLITGNVTRDPALRFTQGGTAILGFGVAVNDYRKNQQTGEYDQYANFLDCVCFGSHAESLQKLLHKGSKVAIEGRLRWSSWEKDGIRRSKVEIVAERVELMSKGQAQGQGYNVPQLPPDAAQPAYDGPPAPHQEPTGPDSYIAEDIPF